MVTLYKKGKMKNLFKVVFSSITFVVSCGATAGVALSDVPNWKNVGDKYQSYDYSDAIPEDKIVAENPRYAVIFQSAGNSCAAGSFFLVDKKFKSYKAVDAKNCDDRKFKVELIQDYLNFKKNGKITAQYMLEK